jgi:hypothetical protein
MHFTHVCYMLSYVILLHVIIQTRKYLMTGTNYEAPHYAIMSSFPFLRSNVFIILLVHRPMYKFGK